MVSGSNDNLVIMMRTDDLEEFSKMLLNSNEIENELGAMVQNLTSQAMQNMDLELNSDGKLS